MWVICVSIVGYFIAIFEFYSLFKAFIDDFFPMRGLICHRFGGMSGIFERIAC